MMERRECGSAIVEFTWVTILLLVPLVYILVAVFDAQRAAYGVTAASTAGVRAFTQSPSVALAEPAAHEAVQRTLTDFGLPTGTSAVQCDPECFQPGSTVRVTVSVRQPLPLAPDLFGDSLAGIDVSSTHTEPFGQYRVGR